MRKGPGPRPSRPGRSVRNAGLQAAGLWSFVALAGLAPARYLLYVNAEDGRTKAKAHTQTALVIAAD